MRNRACARTALQLAAPPTVDVNRYSTWPCWVTLKCCFMGRFSFATKARSPGYSCIKVCTTSPMLELGGTPSSIFARPSQAGCRGLGMTTVMFNGRSVATSRVTYTEQVLRIRELADLARTLDAYTFAAQMGPFVLMQRPTPESLKHPAARDWQLNTAQLPAVSVKGPPVPVDFEELLVATLPPVGADGTLQLIIGRSPECDLVLDDPAASSRHAAIRWDGKAGVLQELGSSNGTFLNGIKLGMYAALRTGDTIAFGRSNFIYLLTGELHARLLRMK